MKNLIVIVVAVIILIIVFKSKVTTTVTTTNLPASENISTNVVSTLTVPKPMISSVPTITSINPVGVLQTKKLNPNLKTIDLKSATQNVVFQSGRDPLEASQPPSITITDDSSALSFVDKILAATLPSSKPKFAPVSLGPSIQQQANSLISFYANAPSGFVDGGSSYNAGGNSVDSFV